MTEIHVSHNDEHKDEHKIDEAVWQAWLQKNAAKDMVRAAGRKKVAGFLVIIGLILAAVWRFAP